MSKPYLHIGQASDLEGKDYYLYRAFEMLPALLAWSTLVAVVLLSWKRPVWVAIFIIAFDLYWLIKTIFLSVHIRSSWRHIQKNLDINWTERLDSLKWDHLWQLVVMPTAGESKEVIRDSLNSLNDCVWPKDRMIVVLAMEDRSEADRRMGEEIESEYRDKFGIFLTTYHPQGVMGEMRGKGSNETYAMRQVRSVINERNIPYEDILVSSFDIDTKLYPQFFLCLAWHFLTAEKPYRSSFQPIPVYHNNIWEAGALSRVVASSGTFWQMMQQERPERLTTFSSHSMSFKSLVEVDYWQTNIVSEDSRIFWNHYFFYDGDWRTVPLFYPVSMDANIAPSLWKTAKNIYKQQRRWGWGAENVPYIMFNFVKNPKIRFTEKARHTFNLLEGFWSWGTNALLIFALGWLPLMLAPREFTSYLIIRNLPNITRNVMMLSMMGIVTSAVISQAMLKKTSEEYGAKWSVSLILQWILMPVTIIFFGALPGLEAQTRLALSGRWRLGFWITPKARTQQEIMRTSG